MKVHYDDIVDALYIELSAETPDGAIELSDGINIDTTTSGRITGIEILTASSRIDLNTILSYSVDVDKTITATKPPQGVHRFLGKTKWPKSMILPGPSGASSTVLKRTSRSPSIWSLTPLPSSRPWQNKRSRRRVRLNHPVRPQRGGIYSSATQSHVFTW